jgi:CspA family cold shock protein
MSKGKDFRAPRKRGFDDDGPMSYESRPRPARGYGGAPEGGGFGGSPAGGPSSAPMNSGAPPVDAVVKWFKADKGYGFVELAGGQGDAFLHANALHAAGHDSVPSGAKLRVQVGAGAKGAQVTRVLEVDATGVAERPQRSSGEGPRPRRVAPDPSTAVSVTGKVKWFDESKGFGFVASEDGGKDVFVHISILGPAGVSHLTEGQQVTMRVVDTPKGREAISLSV